MILRINKINELRRIILNGQYNNEQAQAAIELVFKAPQQAKSEECVSILMRILSDASQGNFNRSTAFNFLVELGVVTQEMMIAKYTIDLRTSEGYYLRKACRVLGELRAQEAIPELMYLLYHNKEASELLYALEALEKIGALTLDIKKKIYTDTIKGLIKLPIRIGINGLAGIDYPIGRAIKSMLSALEEHGMSTDLEAIPVMFRAINGDEVWFVEAINLGIRLAENSIAPCSVLQYGVPLAVIAAQGNIDWFREDLVSLEGLAIDLARENINPHKTLTEGNPVIVKFGIVPQAFRQAITVARLVPAWFKAARDQGLRDDQLRTALPNIIETSTSVDQLRQVLQIEIEGVGKNIFYEPGEFVCDDCEYDEIGKCGETLCHWDWRPGNCPGNYYQAESVPFAVPIHNPNTKSHPAGLPVTTADRTKTREGYLSAYEGVAYVDGRFVLVPSAGASAIRLCEELNAALEHIKDTAPIRGPPIAVHVKERHSANVTKYIDALGRVHLILDELL
jgi:hypothetical protein